MSQNTMNEQLDMFNYLDTIADMASAINKYGASSVVLNLKQQFPEEFHTLYMEMVKPEKQIPALFKPNAPAM